jgi:hypothetical protein
VIPWLAGWLTACVPVSWAHPTPQAALLSGEVGFDALYFGRIDYQDMEARKKQGRLEFLWSPSPSLGDEAGGSAAAGVRVPCFPL